MNEEELYNEIIDEVFGQYEADSSMEWVRYIHPTNLRGDYGKPLPEPNETMTKEEFVKMVNEDGESRWATAVTVLGIYLYKKNKENNKN